MMFDGCQAGVPLTSSPMSTYGVRAEIRAAVGVWAEMRATSAWIIVKGCRSGPRLFQLR